MVLRHFVYAPDPDIATTVATALQDAGYVATVEDTEDAEWLVLVTLEAELIEPSKSDVMAIAREHGADYDGWEVEHLEDEDA